MAIWDATKQKWVKGNNAPAVPMNLFRAAPAQNIIRVLDFLISLSLVLLSIGN